MGFANRISIFSGFVDTQDKAYIGINWQSHDGADDREPADVIRGSLPRGPAAWTGEGFIFAEAGPFELLATPLRAPRGLFFNQDLDSNQEFDAQHRPRLTNIRIQGAAHQVWQPSLFGPSETPRGVAIFEIPQIGSWQLGGHTATD